MTMPPEKAEHRPRARRESDQIKPELKFTLMTFRAATVDDCPLLAELNHQLIRDEGHRNFPSFSVAS